MDNLDTESTEEETTNEPISIRETLEKNYEEAQEQEAPQSTNFDQAENKAQDTQLQAEPIEVPNSWKADAKQLFARAEQDLQKYIVSREKELQADYTRKTQEAAEKVRQADPMLRVIEQNKDHFERIGRDPEVFFNEMVSADIALSQDPVNALNFLAQSYTGKTLAELIGGSTTQGDFGSNAQYPQFDPRISELQNGFSQLSNYLQQLEEQKLIQNFEQTSSFIENFYTKKDDSGRAVFEHFEAVQNELPAYVRMLKEANPNLSNEEILSAAYEKAVWTNPETRSLMVRSEAEKQKQKANQARRAAGVRPGSPNGKLDIDTSKMSTRQVLEYFAENQ